MNSKDETFGKTYSMPKIEFSTAASDIMVASGETLGVGIEWNSQWDN